MKKRTISLLAAVTAMSVTFTACQQSGSVDPATEVAADTELIESLHLNQFINTVPAGEISLGNTHARAAGKPSAAQIKSAFDVFDEDKSGQISVTELLDILAKSGVKVTMEQCAQLIKMFDANNSGLMEFNEFERLIEEALKHL